MESTNLMTLLQRSTLFAKLTEFDLWLLIHHGKIKLYHQGESVYKRGDFSRGRFCMIVSGRVGIIAESGQVVRGMGHGEIVGEIGVTSPQSKRTATVKAVNPTEVFEWDVHELKDRIPNLMTRLKNLAWKHASNYYE